MNTLRISLFSTLLAASASCFAGGNSTIATCGGDGVNTPTTCGSAATGSTNISIQAPSTPRYVQIIGLTDVSLQAPTVGGAANSNPTATNDLGNSGAAMGFCVVDTYAGTVGLSITGVGSDPTKGVFTATTSDNLTVDFLIGLKGSAVTDSGYGLTTLAQDLTGTGTSTAIAGCSTSKVKVQVGSPAGGIPQNGKTYTITLTMVATPK